MILNETSYNIRNKKKKNKEFKNKKINFVVLLSSDNNSHRIYQFNKNKLIHKLTL